MQALPGVADAGDQFVFHERVDILLPRDFQLSRFYIGKDGLQSLLYGRFILFGDNVAATQHFRMRERCGDVRLIQFFVERERFVKLVRVRRRGRRKPSFP